MIPKTDRAVLSDLALAARQQGISPFVVGAGARLLLLDWALDIKGGRATTDWDIAVGVESWQEFAAFRDALLTFENGKFKLTSCEHRLVHSSGRSIDIIPYGNIESPPGTIIWPTDKRSMSTEPLSICSQLCLKIDLGLGVDISVVTIPALALLKAFAYLERRDRGEIRDLEDIDFILRAYVLQTGNTRIFDEAPELLTSERLAIEHAGAFLLGVDFARDFIDKHLHPIARLVEEAGNPYDALVSALVKPVWEEEQDSTARATVVARFAALGLGLAVGRS